MVPPRALPMFRCAEMGPVVVLEGSVMLPSASKARSCATLRRVGYSQRLAPIQTVAAMSDDFWRDESEWSRSALDEALWNEGYNGVPLRVIECLSSDEVHVIKFACNELIPRIRRMNGEPESQETRVGNVLHLQAVSARAATLARRPVEEHRLLERFWESLPEPGWALIDGRLNRLIPRDQLTWRERKQCEKGYFRTAGRTYLLRSEETSLAELHERFCAQSESIFKEHARHCLPVFRAADEEARQSLGPALGVLCSSCSSGQQDAVLYDSHAWRVFRRAGSWYLGAVIGPYAMEDSHRRIYAMDPTVLMMPLYREGGIGGPVVGQTGYQHPFVRPGGRDVCLGDYGASEGMSERFARMDRAERILTFLVDARQTLVAGYHEKNPLKPYRHLCELPSKVITPEEARQRGLPVYPYYRRQSHGSNC